MLIDWLLPLLLSWGGWREAQGPEGDVSSFRDLFILILPFVQGSFSRIEHFPAAFYLLRIGIRPTRLCGSGTCTLRSHVGENACV